ncbi:MAG: hypothetical protein ABIP90_00685 [Vicinamibacterales bacterium]
MTRIPGLALALPLYLMAATAIGFIDYRVRAHPERGYDVYPQSVVANTEDPPGKYRVLAPFIFEGAVAALPADRVVVWVGFRWLSAFTALLASHVLLTTWFGAASAIAGSLLSSVMLLLTFTNGWPHPDHLVEWALSAAAMAAIARRRDGYFAAVLLLAALNRETSGFLWLLYATCRPWSRPHVVRTLALGAGWTAVYAGLRLWRGVSWYDPWQVSRNLEFLRLMPDNYDPYYRAYAWFGLVLVGPGLWLGWRSWAQQPRLTRSALLVVIPIFLVTAFCFSSIIETRIFTPLVPILAAIVMFAVASPDTQQTGA